MLHRMRNDGLGGEAYYYEEVKKCFLDSFCCCLYRILVVIGEMARWSE